MRRADSRLVGATTRLAFASGLTLGMFFVWLVLWPTRWNNAETEYVSVRSEPAATEPDEPASPITLSDATAPPVDAGLIRQAAAAANTSVISTVAPQTAPALRQSSRRPVTLQLRSGPSASSDLATAPTSRATQFRGSLAVSSDPEGARVSLNGVPVGTTPLLLQGLPVGSQVVRAHKDGYQPWSSGIRVVADERTNVMALLAPAIAP